MPTVELGKIWDLEMRWLLFWYEVHCWQEVLGGDTEMLGGSGVFLPYSMQLSFLTCLFWLAALGFHAYCYCELIRCLSHTAHDPQHQFCQPLCASPPMAEVTSPWQLDSLTGEDPPKDWMLAANVQRSYAEVEFRNLGMGLQPMVWTSESQRETKGRSLRKNHPSQCLDLALSSTKLWVWTWGMTKVPNVWEFVSLLY